MLVIHETGIVDLNRVLDTFNKLDFRITEKKEEDIVTAYQLEVKTGVDEWQDIYHAETEMSVRRMQTVLINQQRLDMDYSSMVEQEKRDRLKTEE